MAKRTNYTYVKKTSAQDMTRIIKAVAFPSGVFFLCLFSISKFKNFGSLLMAPAIAVMWLVGAAVAFWMPSQRKSVLNETCYTIAGYCVSLFLFHEMIAITSGISSSMLMATFNETMATATANAVPGYLQNALYLTSALVPISFLGMQGKRIMQFRINANKQKVIRQIRSFRE